MELLEGLTDDQKAVLGGLAALFISGAIMSASYYLGRWARAKQVRNEARTLSTTAAPAGSRRKAA